MESLNAFKLFIVIPITIFLSSRYLNVNNSNEIESVLTLREMLHNITINVLDIVLLCVMGIILIKNKKMFPMKTASICVFIMIISSFFNFLCMVNENSVPEGLEIYKAHGFKTEKLEEISNVINYIKIYGSNE